MKKIQEAQRILKSLGLPPAQFNEMAALTLLALCNVKPDTKWALAERKSLGVSKGIMSFVEKNYGRAYAPNTRETFRRQVLHQFVQAGLVLYNPDNPNLPTNSPNAHYAITPEALKVIRTYGTDNWIENVKAYISQKGSLSKKYAKKREQRLIPIKLKDGVTLNFSPGKHNQVQIAVIEEFAPRFAPGSKLLYIGDTAKKNLYLDEDTLTKLGIPINQHDKLPDVVFHDAKRNRLCLIEAVTSHGPISPKRMLELEDMLDNVKAGKVYVTAFPDFTEFKRHMGNIAWETEVWIVKHPSHLIHYNGDKFH